MHRAWLQTGIRIYTGSNFKHQQCCPSYDLHAVNSRKLIWCLIHGCIPRSHPNRSWPCNTVTTEEYYYNLSNQFQPAWLWSTYTVVYSLPELYPAAVLHIIYTTGQYMHASTCIHILYIYSGPTVYDVPGFSLNGWCEFCMHMTCSEPSFQYNTEHTKEIL